MKLVRMKHDDPVATAGPTTADVPEEGIKEYESVGWYLDEQKNENMAHTEEETKKPTKRKQSRSLPPAGDE